MYFLNTRLEANHYIIRHWYFNIICARGSGFYKKAHVVSTYVHLQKQPSTARVLVEAVLQTQDIRYRGNEFVHLET